MNKKLVVGLLAVMLFMSPLATSVYAGEIAAQGMSQSDVDSANNLEASSALDISAINGGGGTDILASVGVFFLILIFIAAISANG